MRARVMTALLLSAALAVGSVSAQEAVKAKEYVVLRSDALLTLEQTVNDYLKRGYELYGDLEITAAISYGLQEEYRHPMFYQVVIKR